MAVRFGKSKRGAFTLDLMKIEDFAYRLQQNKTGVMQKVKDFSEGWGRNTKTEYASKISYATGFKSILKLANKTPFSEVVDGETANALIVSVGHKAFVAKFLEVGTKAHYVPHRTRNGGMTTAQVRGISGSKALSDVFNSKRREFARELEQAISELIIK